MSFAAFLFLKESLRNLFIFLKSLIKLILFFQDNPMVPGPRFLSFFFFFLFVPKP